MSKHTPGPWRIDSSYPSVNVVGANGETVCEIYTRAGNDRDLIAAAPDLLAACEMALLDMRYYATIHGESITAIEAAIAKAKGEKP